MWSLVLLVAENVGLPFLFTNMVHVTFDPSSPNGGFCVTASNP